MKIRTNFVTNSSSYSSAEVRIENPLLLEILEKYKSMNTFGEPSWRQFAGIGTSETVEGGAFAYGEYDEEEDEQSDGTTAFYYFDDEGGFSDYPESVNDVLDKIIRIMDDLNRTFNSFDANLYSQMKKELQSKKTEIAKSYTEIEWEYRNNSYGEAEPEVGECVGVDFSCSTQDGLVEKKYYHVAEGVEPKEKIVKKEVF